MKRATHGTDVTTQDTPGKGLPAFGGRAWSAADVVGLDLFDGGFLFPTMVVRESALAYNIELFAGYCRARGVDLAPHGKTTMVPQIFRRQLDAGAWGITVASVVQAMVAAAAGVPRIIIATEVADDAGLDWIAGILNGEGPEILCFADSVAAVERMAARLVGVARPLRVMVEVGMPGGRTGARTVDEARSVARAVAASPSLAMAGVAYFEGIAPGETQDAKDSAVHALIALGRNAAVAIDADRLIPEGSELIVTGGGSQYFDLVVADLTAPWPTASKPHPLLRSGAYVTHDHGLYARVSPFGSRATAGAPRLQPALEVWATVLSVPEPGLAVAGAGRRDLPYDSGLPVPIKVRRVGASAVTDLRGATVDRLNDQHAYLALGPGLSLEVGDRIAFGISHPCSAFDRWRFIPVVDDEYRVLDVYETVF